MNNPPFKIGQKMVRTGPSRRFVIKGNVYTSAGCFQCKCGIWHVMIEEMPKTTELFCTCSCGFNHGMKPYLVGDANKFAPRRSKRAHPLRGGI